MTRNKVLSLLTGQGHGFGLAWPAEESIHRNTLILFDLFRWRTGALGVQESKGRGGLLLSSGAILCVALSACRRKVLLGLLL